MHGHFYTPHVPPGHASEPHPARMTSGPRNAVTPQTSGVFLWVALVGLVWGRVGMGVRVNRRARSAPLSLSGRAHITAVIMWSCLPLHTPYY